jgi:hypothetical protein
MPLEAMPHSGLTSKSSLVSKRSHFTQTKFCVTLRAKALQRHQAKKITQNPSIQVKILLQHHHARSCFCSAACFLLEPSKTFTKTLARDCAARLDPP